MTTLEGSYRHLVLAVTDFSRGELRALAAHSEADTPPSDALVEDLCRTLAGHTQIGRTIRLTAVVLGPIPRDGGSTRIAESLLRWIRENPAA
jgi:hypothetical protein